MIKRETHNRTFEIERIDRPNQRNREAEKIKSVESRVDVDDGAQFLKRL